MLLSVAIFSCCLPLLALALAHVPPLSAGSPSRQGGQTHFFLFFWVSLQLDQIHDLFDRPSRGQHSLTTP